MERERIVPRGLVRALLAGLAACILAPAVPAAPSDANPAARPRQDTSSALVQLAADPLATAARTRPAPGRKIDFSSNNVRSYRAQLAAMRNDYKAWLRANAPQARVTGEFDISLNAVAVELNGATLAQISATPLVKNAQYQGLYYPTIADPDLALISATQAWAVGGGPANAGNGVKVAVVDSGIDVTHPCFDDAGYPAQAKAGPPALTNNKVIVAKVFSNRTPSLRYTPEAINPHGTHVAGTLACNHLTPMTVEGAVIPYDMSGVAPRALLGNYNVFPGETGSARSEDILNALDAAYADGFDVANMSLGGGSNGIQDLLTVAVDNLDLANMVVAVAAGNTGPGLFTIESPGLAARALTAGGSTVPHYLGTPVTVSGTTYGALAGEFATVAADLAAPLGVVAGGVNGLSDACAALPSLAGKIALVSRGTCSFSTKIRNAQAASALAVIVANNAPGDPIPMGQDGTPNQPTIAGYMVSRDDGQALKGLDGATTTIGAGHVYVATVNGDIMYGSSSQGPTDVDFRVKPDVVAPAQSVLSSIPHSACATPPCFAFFSGTSMATPHLAGSAAFLRGLYPDWSAADIRSAVVNTAERGVLKRSANILQLENNVNIAGAGRENLLNAANADVVLSPVSVSFGAVPSGSGQARTAQVTLRNTGSSTGTWTLGTSGGDATVAFSVSAASVTIPAGESATVTVSMVADRGAALGGHQGYLEVTSGTTPVAHAALYTLVK